MAVTYWRSAAVHGFSGRARVCTGIIVSLNIVDDKVLFAFLHAVVL